MNILLDTNILSRMAQPGQRQHRIAVEATDALQRRGDILCLVPQVLYEFWAVATRSIAANGLGLAVSVVASEIARLKSIFPLLPDDLSVFLEWEKLVLAHHVVGKNAHDARLVAAMAVHGITHLLTFNTQDFGRYIGISALDPLQAIPPPAHIP